MNRCTNIFLLLCFAVASAGVAFGETEVDPEMQRWLTEYQAQGGPPIASLSPSDARTALDAIQSSTKLETEPADIEDRELPVGPAGKTRVRLIRPPAIKEALPAILYFHGGGWIVGDTQTHDRLVREIANGARAEVIFIDYDRAPEAKYPVALEQGYATMQFVVKKSRDFNIVPDKIAVAGDSAGGNIATVMTLLAKNRGGARICTQVLFYPVTDANFETDSYKQFANGPWLTKAAMQLFWDVYLPDPEIRRHPTASPLQASIEELRGLPPALIITAENDVLRDEGEAYGKKLEQAGVRVKSVRSLGTIHDFVMLNPLSNSAATRKAISLACDQLRDAFSETGVSGPVHAAAP